MPSTRTLEGAVRRQHCRRQGKRQIRRLHGGSGDSGSCRFEPTIIYPVDKDEPIVNKELFCPLLPVVPFKDAEVGAILDTIEEREHPLAMYLFTRDIESILTTAAGSSRS